jgi:ABC-type antimicrobial peptide transport system permease subunit
MIIAFGIFGTVLMMMMERRKEFGVIVAIGMQKYKLSYVLILETVLLGLVGVISGIAVSIPITWYFIFHPIPFTGQAAETMLQMGFEPVMSFSMTPSVFYNQAVTILIFILFITYTGLRLIMHFTVNINFRKDDSFICMAKFVAE